MPEVSSQVEVSSLATQTKPIIPKKPLARRTFENAYHAATWQWNFTTSLQNTKCYTVCAISKSIFELPKNVATGGWVYAGIMFGTHVFGIPQAQRVISWTISNVAGQVGKQLGRIIDLTSGKGPYYNQSFQYYGAQIGSVIPTAVFTLFPWIAYPQLKLASVILGLIGANVTRILLPNYTNVQAFFYFLCSDIPFYTNFKAANLEDPYYGRKIQFNTEQFFSKKTSTQIKDVLESIDSVGNRYKSVGHKLSQTAIEIGNDTPLASWYSVTKFESVKPILEQSSSIQKRYYESLEKGQERLEKYILEQLPQNEQCLKRLHQLELNKTLRMIQNGEINENEIEAVLDKLDIQYKKTIGGKLLDNWTEEYEFQKELEIQLARLEQSEGVEERVVEINQALENTRQACDDLWKDIELHNPKHLVVHLKSYKQTIDNQAKETIQKEKQATQSLKKWSAHYSVLKEAEIKLFNLENNPEATPEELEETKEQLETIKKESTALLAQAELHNDPSLMSNIKEEVAKLEDDFNSIKNNVSLANQSPEVFSETVKQEIDTILGDCQQSNFSYAKKIAMYILEVKDPLKEWSLSDRSKEHLRFFTEISDILDGFEERTTKTERRCKRKLRNYILEEVKGQKPPNANVFTKLKQTVNKGFYEIFGCEPFQSVAQHKSPRFNTAFILTVGLMATFGIAALCGIPVSLGLGIGGGVIGVGAAMGSGRPNALVSLGENAKGLQKHFNQKAQEQQLAKPLDLSGSKESLKVTEISLESINIPPNNPLLLPVAPVAPSPSQMDFDLSKAYNEIAPFPTLQERVEEGFKNSQPTAASKPKSIEVSSKKSIQKSAKPSFSTTNPSNKPISKPLKPAKPLVKLATANPALQQTFVLSALYHTSKNFVQSIGSLLKAGGQFSKNMWTANNDKATPEEKRKAKEENDKKASKLIKDVSELAHHPIDNAKKYCKNRAHEVSEALEKTGQKLEEGQVWQAGQEAVPIVELATDIALIAQGGAGIVGKVAKSTSTLSKAEALSECTKIASKTVKPLTAAEELSYALTETKPLKPKLSEAPSPHDVVSTIQAPRNILPLYETQKISHEIVSSSEGLWGKLPVETAPKIIPSSAQELTSTPNTSLGKTAGQALETAAQSESRLVATESVAANAPILFSQKVNAVSNSVPSVSKTLENSSSISNIPKTTSKISQEALHQANQAKFLLGLKSVLQKYEFRSPITFRFQSGKLYSGLPIDVIKIQTPVKKKITRATFNVIGKQHPYYPQVMCYTDQIYKEHIKHKPNKKGKAMWEGASVNPISNPGEAQKLLETAYFCNDQAFNVRVFKDHRGKIEKQIIRFHHENQNNVWHCYELTEDFQQKIGKNGIMARFKEDGLITDSQYNDLRKNKWNK